MVLPLCFVSARKRKKQIELGKRPPPKTNKHGPLYEKLGRQPLDYYKKGKFEPRPGGYNTRRNGPVSSSPSNELIGAPSTKRRRNTIESSSDNDGYYSDNIDFGNIDEPIISTPLQSKQKRVITSSNENDHPFASSIPNPRRIPPIQRSYSSLIADQILAEEKERELKRRREKSGVDMEYNENESADDEEQFENNGIENSEDEEGHSLNNESEDDHIVVDIDMNGQGDCKSIRSSTSGESSSTDPFPSGSDSSSGTLHSEGSVFHFERFHDKAPDFRNIELFTKPSFNQDDDEQSELSGYSMTDEESLDALSEFSDFDYQNVREFEKTNREKKAFKLYKSCLSTLENYVSSFWSKVKDLNDKRNDMIYVLNKQLKKPRSFSNTDVTYFNIRIAAIEANLNTSVIMMSPFKCQFIKGSDQKVVMFRGYKYAKVPMRPGLYGCTFGQNYADACNVDPETLDFLYDELPPIFNPLWGCYGQLKLDDKGFLQPGSTIRHNHDPVEEKSHFPELPTPVIAVSKRFNDEGEVQGKRAKIAVFLEEKLKESMEYNLMMQEVNHYLPNIQDHLEKLKSINLAELEEAEQNYLKSSIEWMDFFLMHVVTESFR